MELMEHQLEAIEQLGSGKILWGGVGTGKSATVLGYYEKYESPRHIIVITTAKKRDSLDWEKEAMHFAIGDTDFTTAHGRLEVNSWNNIKHYENVTDAFFVFDEQRLVGHGAWVKSFLKIAKKNHWVLLSATPGDHWMDYAPVFVANGFYRNLTDFKHQHVLYEPFIKFPKIRGWLNERKLEILRNDMLVEMPYDTGTTRYLNYIDVGYDEKAIKRLLKARWNPFTDEPVKGAAELFRVLRRIVNGDPSRLETIRWLIDFNPRLIIFYTFDYELEILRTLNDEIDVYEWNGHRKNDLPESDGHDSWVYLVQYTSGAEGWNCVSTDSMVLYSLTHSYKWFMQCQGRIDRMNTKFEKLYYYVLMSQSKSDLAVRAALRDKKDFNWRAYAHRLEEENL